MRCQRPQDRREACRKEGYGIGIEYGYEEKNFLHKNKRIYIIYKEQNIDWLLDLYYESQKVCQDTRPLPDDEIKAL